MCIRDRNIFPALLERRNLKAQHIQPVVEILAEGRLIHKGFQFLIGGGNNPDIHIDNRVAADARDFLFLQDTKQTRLQLSLIHIYKIRKLEYLLGDAVQRRADVVIASGKCQSNLCSLAVSACSKADLDCVIIHNDDKPERAEGNQLLNSLSGADMRFICLLYTSPPFCISYFSTAGACE